MKPNPTGGLSMLRGALDLLFGSFCLFCSGPAPPGSGGLCSDCLQSLRPLGREVCSVCGAPGEGEGPCRRCREGSPGFDLARSYAEYTGPARDMVAAYKYGGRHVLARPLGGLMARWAGEALAGLGPVEVLAPVPLHPKGLRARGYNQAALLAGRVGRGLGVGVDYGSLVKVKNTAPQAGLAGIERFLNVEGAFSVRRKGSFSGKTVGLVDDVFTSGATAGECAKTLKQGGAKRVVALTFARVVPGPGSE